MNILDYYISLWNTFKYVSQLFINTAKRFSREKKEPVPKVESKMTRTRDNHGRNRSLFTTRSNYSNDRLGSENAYSEGCIPRQSMSFINRSILHNCYNYAHGYGDCVNVPNSTAVVTSQGIMSLALRGDIRVEITLDKAIRLINFKNHIVLALSPTGSTAALLHPNGRVYQYGSRVEILAYDSLGNNKYAKMWYKGVSFTSDQCALVYLVDAAGTRTTTDNFSDLSGDFSLHVFKCESTYGPGQVQDAISMLQRAQHWTAEDGTETWMVNNLRITQTLDGLVRIYRSGNKYLMRTSPTNGSASLTTPFIHCTGSLGDTRHMFVRRGERRMHFDGNSFIVRNAGHSAGFDDKQQLKVY